MAVLVPSKEHPGARARHVRAELGSGDRRSFYAPGRWSTALWATGETVLLGCSSHNRFFF